MKIIFFLLLASLTFFSCNKGDKKQTKYRIEASASEITDVTFNSRDEEQPVYLFHYNQPTWEKEWVGYNSNEILLIISHDDQSGHIKFYVDGKLEKDIATDGLENATTLKFEN